MSEISAKDPSGPPNLIVFPNRIRRLRLAARISLASLARSAEISTGHMSYIERGLRSPSEDKIAQIARIFEVEPELLSVGPESEDEYREWFQLTEIRREESSPILLLGSRLREIRLRLGLTMGEVAKRTVEINPWLIRDFEVSGRKPDARQMLLLSRAFGYDTLEEFSAVLAKIELELHPDLDTDRGRDAISRGVEMALKSSHQSHPSLFLDEAMSDGKPQKSRSLDGDLLAGNTPFLAGSVIRLVKLARPDDRTLCVVMTGNFPAAIGRTHRGKVRDAKGRQIRGDLWRVESIQYPPKIF